MARRRGSAAAAGDTGDELVVHALRLVENTDRFSSDMRALEKGERAGEGIACVFVSAVDAGDRGRVYVTSGVGEFRFFFFEYSSSDSNAFVASVVYHTSHASAFSSDTVV